MKKQLLLLTSLMLAMVAVVQPALSQEQKTAPGHEVDEPKADKHDQKQTKTKAQAKKKPARNVVKILPLKATKEMAK